VTTMSDPTKGERVRTSRSNPTTIAPPIGSYSHAVRVETAECVWLYVSGPADPPASTAVQVAALVVPEALIEVDVVAAVPVGVRT
jgi:enamine deaminase RidA (YjgF/YER057c/UK114 family)